MADDKRLFSSTYHGGRLGNQSAHHQRQRNSTSDPLKDLQHLLSRLLSERDSGDGGYAARHQAFGDTWLYDDPFRQPLQHQQSHGRFFSDQDRMTRSYHDEVQLDRATEIPGASADFGLNVRRLGNDLQTRQRDGLDRLHASGVKSSGAEVLERQYRVSRQEPLFKEDRGERGGETYDHWFTENSSSDPLWQRPARPPTATNGRQAGGNRGGARGEDSWRRLTDSGGGGKSEIPVIDRRTERGLGGATNHDRVSRVPPSPSWPLTCVIQQREFSHYSRPTSFYQEVETTDLRPIGQGICDLTDDSPRQPEAAAAARLQREAIWHQTLPITVAEAAPPVRRKLSAPISAKREATLRASAEKLDSLSSTGVSPSWQQHRRAVSSGDNHRGLVSISGDAPDYEAIAKLGDDTGRQESGEAEQCAAVASMPLWYRPSISREQAIAALTQAQPGSFLIRDSHTYPGAFGLAVRVPRSPALSAPESQRQQQQQQQELIRHFLIESFKSGGVRLRGCANEPVFANLVELVQCHQQVPLALPCKLRLPGAPQQLHQQPQPPVQPTATLLRRPNGSFDETSRRGNSYRVLYFCTVDVPSCVPTPNSSWASDAVSGAVNQVVVATADSPRPVECRMRVSDKGVKLSGLGWHKEFRLAYAAQDCSMCRLDPNGRRFFDTKTRIESRLFGLIVKKYGLYGNQSACLVLGDLEANQPAAVVAAFINRCIRSGDGR